MRGAIILVGLLAGSVPAREAPSTSAAPAPSVRSAPPLVGVVSAARALDLLPRGEGRLEELLVHLGERVEAGQLVARLETRTLELEVRSRQAQRQAAEAETKRTMIQAMLEPAARERREWHERR